jgi:hypothetical protein
LEKLLLTGDVVDIEVNRALAPAFAKMTFPCSTATSVPLTNKFPVAE